MTESITIYLIDPATDDEAKVQVEFDYSPERPGRMYMPNGDPGYPDEPEEIEVIMITPIEWFEVINQNSQLKVKVENICAEYVRERIQEYANDV